MQLRRIEEERGFKQQAENCADDDDYQMNGKSYNLDPFKAIGLRKNSPENAEKLPKGMRTVQSDLCLYIYERGMGK
jgi:hypothetical protein